MDSVKDWNVFSTRSCKKISVKIIWVTLVGTVKPKNKEENYKSSDKIIACKKTKQVFFSRGKILLTTRWHDKVKSLRNIYYK